VLEDQAVEHADAEPRSEQSPDEHVAHVAGASDHEHVSVLTGGHGQGETPPLVPPLVSVVVVVVVVVVGCVVVVVVVGAVVVVGVVVVGAVVGTVVVGAVVGTVVAVGSGSSPPSSEETIASATPSPTTEATKTTITALRPPLRPPGGSEGGVADPRPACGGGTSMRRVGSSCTKRKV
jgi:hypothetical protein